MTDQSHVEQQPATPTRGISTGRGIAIVAGGILAATAVIFAVYQASQPSDLDCALQRAEYAAGERPIYDVDDACR